MVNVVPSVESERGSANEGNEWRLLLAGVSMVC